MIDTLGATWPYNGRTLPGDWDQGRRVSNRRFADSSSLCIVSE
jgi:hypothetical protein